MTPLYFAVISLNATVSTFTPGDMFVVVYSGREVQTLQAQWSSLGALLLTALVHLLHLQDAVKHNSAEPQGGSEIHVKCHFGCCCCLCLTSAQTHTGPDTQASA